MKGWDSVTRSFWQIDGMKTGISDAGTQGRICGRGLWRSGCPISTTRPHLQCGDVACYFSIFYNNFCQLFCQLLMPAKVGGSVRNRTRVYWGRTIPHTPLGYADYMPGRVFLIPYSVVAMGDATPPPPERPFAPPFRPSSFPLPIAVFVWYWLQRVR